MDCSPPGSSVHGILQARILEWVAYPFSRGSFLTQELNSGLLHRRQILYHLSHQRSPNCSLVSTKDWGNYSGGSGRRWAIELLENLSLFHFFFCSWGEIWSTHVNVYHLAGWGLPPAFSFGGGRSPWTTWCVVSQFHDQGSNLWPLQWKHRVLTTEPPGKSP